MDPIVACLCAALIGYLLGCINPAYFIARAKGIDILNMGTGNPGASNTMMLLGWKAGILVGLHDIGKAVLAVLLCALLFPSAPLVREIAGTACILGHLFPFYLAFRGGKGFASTLGVIGALDWRFALILLAAIIVLVLITDYIVVGTMLTVVSYPIYCFVTSRLIAAALLTATALIIIYRHRANFIRICNGTEVGLRRANRGELRVDRQK